MSGSGMTALIQERLDPAFHWSTWPNSYQNVLPYVRDAFDLAIATLLNSLPQRLHPEVDELIRELCEPDPALRGFPSRRGNARQFSMERYVSHFDRIARIAEIDIRRQLSQ